MISKQNSKPKLAVIGTGIAGLSATWLLRKKFDVTVYESQPRAGMGVHTIDYASGGVERRIDIPLRIFTEGYYSNLLALYKHIDAEVVATDHAGVFADGDGEIMLHYGNGGIAGFDYSYLKNDSLFSPRAWKIALQSRRFFKSARNDFRKGQIGGSDLTHLSFGEYLERSGAGDDFIDIVLLPMMSVTCTCDFESIKNYPADIMLGYLTSGLQKLGIMSAAKGVDDIVPRLLQDTKVKTNSAVTKILTGGDQLSVTTTTGETEKYDQVVVAAQAQHAAAMLAGFKTQQELLEKVPFERSVMSVHTDKGLLPKSPAPLAPVSYHIPAGSNRAEVTVNLTDTIPRLSGQDTIFQTWNPIRDPDPAKELARVPFTRPVVNHESRQAARSLRDFHHQQGNRLWLCGSYMADKIPLLDAAVESSMHVARQLGVKIPWEDIPAN